MLSKFCKNLRLKRKGSALLVALIFTGLLTLVTIGVGTLISRESRQLVNLIDGTKAYFAAESGIELALLDLQEGKPGFEVNETSLNLNEVSGAVLDYKIQALTNRIPYLTKYEADALDRGNVRFPAEASYNEMALNDSITIPLANEIQEFRVDYYWPLGPRLSESRLNQYDVIRWKLFGTSKTTGKIDSISEFMPAAFLEDSTRGTTPERPTCLGLNGSFCWNAGTFFPSSIEADEADFEPGSVVTIRDFLATHKDSYLILSNFLDPAKINDRGLAIDTKKGASIFYRVWDIASLGNSGQSGNLVTPFAEIEATGYSKSSSHKLNVQVAPNSFLPIFDFALYRPKL